MLLLAFVLCVGYSIADQNKCSMDKPCTNGGACIKKDGFYQCNCPPEFTGDLCKTKKGQQPAQLMGSGQAPGSIKKKRLWTSVVGPCGVFTTLLGKRVINGIPTNNPASWAWLLSMKVKQGPKPPIHICGASLITNQWALTAAHCFFDQSGRRIVYEPMLVVFAGAKLESGLGGTPYSVERIVIHPMYDPLSKAFYHDIALIKLVPEVIIAPHVCLPVPGAPILSPRCIVAGWGYKATWPGKIRPFILREASLPIVEPFRCSIDPRIQICAGGQGTSGCMGDSGGPLFCEDYGKWVLQGVVSNGDTRCPTSIPSEFTRVGSYMGWIVGIVNGMT